MTVNSMYQLMGAIQKNPQAVGEAVANGVGAGFEDLLHQASQNNRPAANNSQTNKTNKADKQPDGQKTGANNDGKPVAGENQNSQSGKADQTAGATPNQPEENQQVLAAALVAGPAVPVVQIITPVEEAEAAPVMTLDNAGNGVNLVVNAQETAVVQTGAATLPQTDLTGQQNVGVQQQTAAPEQQGEILTQTQVMTNTQTAGEQQSGGLQNTVNQQAGELNNPQQTATLQTGDATANNAANQQQGQTEENSDEVVGFQTPVFGNSEAVPVKVAAPEQTLEPQADNAADQLAQRINQALAQGESRVTLSLTPANLGSLTVEISRLSDGTLHILLSAVTEKAAGLLDKHSGSLQSLLAGNMPGTVRVEVENRMGDANPQQFLNPDQQQEQNNQQESREQQRQNSEDKAAANIDFMQQLRLGLVDLQEQ